MRLPRVLVAVAALLFCASCEDLRGYAGTWQGRVSSDPALRHGVAADVEARVVIEQVSRDVLEANVEWPVGAAPLRFARIESARGDALSEMRLPGEPLRSYLGWLEPANAPPFLAVVSLYGEERIELRVIRGRDETYAVFALARVTAR